MASLTKAELLRINAELSAQNLELRCKLEEARAHTRLVRDDGFKYTIEKHGPKSLRMVVQKDVPVVEIMALSSQIAREHGKAVFISRV